MKISCINPPLEDFFCTSIRRQPLGLLYLAAALRAACNEVRLLNFHSPKKASIPIPEEFSYLLPYKENNKNHPPFPFKRYYHFGNSFQEIGRKISNDDSDLYLVSSLFTTYYQEVREVISLIRKYHQSAVVAVGGYHAALHPDFFLKGNLADYVVCGEGEETVVRLADHLAGKIPVSSVPNLIYCEDGLIHRTEKKFIQDIDTIHPPARDLLKARDFKMYKKRSVSMITSRGCPNHCDFCSAKSLWGNSFRVRKVPLLIREVESCIDTLGTDIVNFEDDNLMAARERTIALLKGLADLQKLKNKRLDLTAMNGISLEKLDDEILKLMKKAGFSEINISLVTYSTSIQKAHSRPFDTNKFAYIASTAKAMGMNVRGYYILGLPDQTRAEIDDILGFMGELGIKIFPSVYYNVNSPMAEWKAQRSSAFYNETAHLSRDDLLYYFHKSYENNQCS